jgi:drug/metabolite transporter (DMT)-like permease
VSRADGGRALGAWLGVVAIWSTTPLTIKWSAEGLGAVAGFSGRTLVGAAIFLLAFLTPWLKFDHRPEVWRAAAVIASFTVISMLLAYYSAPALPSGLLSVIYGLSPLVTALLAAFVTREETLTAAKAAGTLLGFGGVALIFGGGGALGAGVPLALALCTLSMLVNCVALLVVKRIGRDLPVASITAASVWACAPVVTLIWWAVDGRLPEAPPLRAVAAVLWLGLMGTVFGFLLWYYALKHMAATRVALIMLVTPVTALLLGHVVNDERLTPSLWMGALLVLTGIALVLLPPKRVG